MDFDLGALETPFGFLPGAAGFEGFDCSNEHEDKHEQHVDQEVGDEEESHDGSEGALAALLKSRLEEQHESDEGEQTDVVEDGKSELDFALVRASNQDVGQHLESRRDTYKEEEGETEDELGGRAAAPGLQSSRANRTRVS